MLLISIEGIDGSGKTTVAKEIVRRLKEKGKNATYTKEPFTEDITGIIQRVGWNDPIALTLLFAADRRIHVKWMEEQNVDTIITDRYIHSTIAYQSVMGIDEKWIRNVNSKFPYPDLVILLDLDPTIASSRIKKGDIFDFPEKRKTLEKVRNKYLELASMEHFLIVNADKPFEEVIDSIMFYLLDQIP